MSKKPTDTLEANLNRFADLLIKEAEKKETTYSDKVEAFKVITGFYGIVAKQKPEKEKPEEAGDEFSFEQYNSREEADERSTSVRARRRQQ